MARNNGTRKNLDVEAYKRRLILTVEGLKRKYSLPSIFPYLENISLISSRSSLSVGKLPIKTRLRSNSGSSLFVCLLLVTALAGFLLPLPKGDRDRDLDLDLDLDLERPLRLESPRRLMALSFS